MPVVISDRRDPLARVLDEEEKLTGIAAGSSAIIFCERQRMLQLENQLEHFGADCRGTDSIAVAKAWVTEAIRNNNLPSLIAWDARRMETLKALLDLNRCARPAILSIGGESKGCFDLDPTELDNRQRVTKVLLQALGILPSGD